MCSHCCSPLTFVAYHRGKLRFPFWGRRSEQVTLSITHYFLPNCWMHWIMQMAETERDEVRQRASDWVGRSCAARLHMPWELRLNKHQPEREKVRAMQSHAWGAILLNYMHYSVFRSRSMRQCWCISLLCVNVQRKVSWVSTVLSLQETQLSSLVSPLHPEHGCWWSLRFLLPLTPSLPTSQLFLHLSFQFVHVKPGYLLFGTDVELRSGIDWGQVTQPDAKAWWNSTIWVKQVPLDINDSWTSTPDL